MKIQRTALTNIENGQRRVEAIELALLAKLYRQPVGYFTGEDAAASLPIDVAHLARKAADLSVQDRTELGRKGDHLHRPPVSIRQARHHSFRRGGALSAALAEWVADSR